MKLPVSWLRDFVDVKADVRAIADALASIGFEVAAIEGETIDLEITANRPDCLTIEGLAREVSTKYQVPFVQKEPVVPVVPNVPVVPVRVSDPGCGRYALVMVDVKVAASPAWLAERLLAAGVRPINNVVDVTNYVMLEIQPMHAFDAARLAGPEINVRLAKPGEKIVTLDGQTRTLDATMLVVADRDRPEAVAGVMGGAGSEVSASTTRIALESAWWQPAQVRRTGRKLGLKTEAGARFERGMDINGPLRALRRAIELFERIGAGKPAGPIVDVYPSPFAPVTIGLIADRIERLLGDAVPAAEVERILTGLGFTVTAAAGGWTIGVPTFRVDVRREADLIEEVGRHWGFNRIPATFPALRQAPPAMSAAVSHSRTVRRVLTAAGLQEACTFTFMESQAATPFVADASALVTIANPLSEKFAVLRPSLLPGLLDALVYSRRRETADVRLFEAGSVFGSSGERQAVGWMMTGSRGDHWSGGAAAIDFFDAKGIAELLAQAFGIQVAAGVADLPWFLPGRAATLTAIRDGGQLPLGVIGQIRPEIAAARGLGDGEIVVGGELDLAPLVGSGAAGATGGDRRVAPIPRFPSIVRDLSIVIDERLPAAAVRGTIRANAPSTLVAVREFDRYQGRGVLEGHVSLSIRLTFRAPDRTLTDAEAQQSVDAIVAALAREHSAKLRGQ